MKEVFEQAEISLVSFYSEDVIRTSGGNMGEWDEEM